MGLLAALGLASGAVSGAAGQTSPAATVVDTYVDVAQNPGPVTASWPIDYNSQDNNPVVGRVALSDGPKYLVNVPALVNSAPVMAGQDLYVAGGFVSGPRREAHPGYVWAINPADGALIWTESLPNSVFAQPIVADNILLVGVGNAAFAQPSLSPATTPGMVRGVGPSGLYAFNATNGQALWSFKTQGADQAPPTVVGNTVYLASGSRRLYALSLSTGRAQWSVNIGHYVSRSSPRIMNHMAYMGGAGPLGVVAVDLKTHRVAWQRPITGALQGVDDTPIAVSKSRLISAAMAGPEHLPSSSKQHEAMIYALNPTTGAMVWSTVVARGAAPPFKATGTPVVVGQRIYAGNAINGRVVCLSLETGHVIWSVPTGSPVTRPVAVVDHRVYALTKTGMLVAISMKGHIMAKEFVAHFVNTYGPVIYNHTLSLSGNTAHQGYVGATPLFGLPR